LFFSSPAVNLREKIDFFRFFRRKDTFYEMDSKTILYNLINDIKMEIYDSKHTIMIIKQKQHKTIQDNKSKKKLELYLKLNENKLKYDKLLLLWAQNYYNDTLNDKLSDMINNKRKENMVERMEIVEEFAEEGILNDGEYLHVSNNCKKMYEL